MPAVAGDQPVAALVGHQHTLVGAHRTDRAVERQRPHDHRCVHRGRDAFRFRDRVTQRPHRLRDTGDRGGVRRARNPDRLALGHPVQLVGLHRHRGAGVAEHQARRRQVVHRSQLTGAGHHHIELVGAAVDEKGVAAPLSEWLEVRKEARAEADEDRDGDSGRYRPAVELQRIVEHPGVPPHDCVLDAAQQEAPTADLDLGGKPKTRHRLLADTQAPMDG